MIPDKAELTGTVRTFSAAAQDIVEARFNQICAGTGSSFGASVDLKYLREAPAVVNSEVPVSHVLRAAGKICPEGLTEHGDARCD